jgi:predicted SAM-dependent methyltransferase
LKLHLGCGNRRIQGFVHVDVLAFAHLGARARVDALPFADGAFELAYASHVLEHFGRHEQRRVLAEWFRVVAPGGWLRLAVPDFGAVVAAYPTFGIEAVTGLVCGGQRDVYDFHKMIFDRASLGRALAEVGFVEVREWDWRATEHAGIDDYSQAYLPHLDKATGRLMSLNVEARHPTEHGPGARGL